MLFSVFIRRYEIMFTMASDVHWDLFSSRTKKSCQMHVAKGELLVVTRIANGLVSRVANGLDELVRDLGLLRAGLVLRLDNAAVGGLAVFGPRYVDGRLNLGLIVLCGIFDSFLIRLIDIVVDTVMDTADIIVMDTATDIIMDTAGIVIDTAGIVMDTAGIVMDTDTDIVMDIVMDTTIDMDNVMDIAIDMDTDIIIVGKGCLLLNFSSITFC